MKFKITMKDPDGVYESIKDAADASLANVEGLSGHERNELIENRVEQIGESIGKWFEYKEYLTVEIDTDKQTCVVVEN